ncbi:alpha/beta hydrolase [Lutimaribacter marinistellae]|uniref:Alpha/beta hydrolase n=1 Tax=Lutimaribacter marinistellae TaxID=1820329 RepID=A0ABV7THZ9_9RHOB
MPVIRVNVTGQAARLHDSPRPLHGVLRQTRNAPGPVIIMTHGFKYRPGSAEHCPHDHMLSLSPRPMPWVAPSWPRALGFGGDKPDEGLAIAFGWDARGALWQAQRRAVEAGRMLAEMIRTLRRLNPDRPVHFLGHSMGIEVALEALHHLPDGGLDRIVSLTGAAYRARTRAALATPAGQRAEFINITSRENDLFDFLFERIIAPPRRGDRAIGLGLDAPNAVTLQLDCPGTLDYISRLAHPVAEAQHRICHWSSYMRPGVLGFYNVLLRERDRICLDTLRRGLPETPAPRWSRLLALPRPDLPLPFASKAS